MIKIKLVITCHKHVLKPILTNYIYRKIHKKVKYGKPLKKRFCLSEKNDNKGCSL